MFFTAFLGLLIWNGEYTHGKSHQNGGTREHKSKVRLKVIYPKSKFPELWDANEEICTHSLGFEVALESSFSILIRPVLMKSSSIFSTPNNLHINRVFFPTVAKKHLTRFQVEKRVMSTLLCWKACYVHALRGAGVGSINLLLSTLF